MAAETDGNSLAPQGRGRSTAAGDVPEALRRRYYLDGRGGELGFYVDAQVATPAFRDHGRRLSAGRNDPNAIRDMVAVARHRGWTIVVAQGDPGFRREAWLAGRAAGLEVRGHRPTERDLQELQRRTERRERAEARGRGEDDGRVRAGQRPDGRERAAAREAEGRRARDVPEDAAVRARMRVVEAVVRGRVGDPAAQGRILEAARGRLADWLERGARVAPLPREAEAGRRERVR